MNNLPKIKPRAITWTDDQDIEHRDEDLPSVIWWDGKIEYHKNGELHRDGDLPAEIWPDGAVTYWKHGRYHRNGDKPAIIGVYDNTDMYYKNGEQYEP
jgi:hypothetical protein